MDTKDALAVFAALAQPTRLEALRWLVSRAPEGQPAGGVARRMRTPQNTMSAHLAVLARCGLVQAERHGREIHYRAEPERLHELMAFLLAACCGGRPDFCADVAQAAVEPTLSVMDSSTAKDTADA